MNRIRLLKWMMLVCIILYSCESEDETPTNSLELTSLEVDSQLRELVSTLTPGQKGSSSAGTVEESILDLVDWNRVSKVTQPEMNRVAYAVANPKAFKDHGYVENLMIYESDEKQGAYIIQYDAVPGWFETHNLVDNIQEYSGYIRMISLGGGLLAYSYLENGTSVRPQRGSANNGDQECDPWIEIEFTVITPCGHYCNEIQEFTYFVANDCPVSPPDEGGIEPIELPGDGGGVGGAGLPIIPVTPPSIDPSNSEPCAGDPVLEPEVAPTENSGKRGGTFGNTRTGGAQFHDGLDIAATPGTQFRPIMGGRVIYVRSSFGTYEHQQRSYGNKVIIRTSLPDGTELDMHYNHMDGIFVQNNQVVTTDTFLGESGQTGNAALEGVVPHIHIKARRRVNGTPVARNDPRNNPANYMNTTVLENGETITNPCL